MLRLRVARCSLILITHGVAEMLDKRYLALIADFAQWKGDTYRLVALVLELKVQIDAENAPPTEEVAGE